MKRGKEQAWRYEARKIQARQKRKVEIMAKEMNCNPVQAIGRFLDTSTLSLRYRKGYIVSFLIQFAVPMRKEILKERLREMFGELDGL